MKKLHRLPKLSPMIVFLLVICGSLSLDTSVNINRSRIYAQTILAKKSFNYEDYDQVLKNYVRSGRVNYKSLQRKDNRKELDSFNTALGSLNSSIYEGWSESEKIAFLINAYNSFTLESIIDQKPLTKSIQHISGVWTNRKFKIAGQLKTLYDIKYQILRKQFNDPRIHMALVYAAKSSPPLRNEPYTGAKLDTQLDDQTRQFLASPEGFEIDYQKNRVYLSRIFKWFGVDWLKTYGVNDDRFTGNPRQRAVLNFISQYLDEDDRDYLIRGNYQLNYLRYDWSLNDQ